MQIPFSWIFNAISSEKSCLISKPFLTCLLDVRTLDFLPPAEFKFPARQPYASLERKEKNLQPVDGQFESDDVAKSCQFHLNTLRADGVTS